MDTEARMHKMVGLCRTENKAECRTHKAIAGSRLDEDIPMSRVLERYLIQSLKFNASPTAIRISTYKRRATSSIHMAALLQNTCKTDDRMLISTIYKLRKEQNSPNILNGQRLLEDETPNEIQVGNS